MIASVGLEELTARSGELVDLPNRAVARHGEFVSSHRYAPILYTGIADNQQLDQGTTYSILTSMIPAFLSPALELSS